VFYKRISNINIILFAARLGWCPRCVTWRGSLIETSLAGQVGRSVCLSISQDWITKVIA